MNFTGVINEIKEAPELESNAAYIKIKEVVEAGERDIKSNFSTENNIERDIGIKDWENSQKDKYIRLLVEFYIGVIDDMYKKLNKTTGESLEKSTSDRKIYELFIDISNEKIEDILYEQRDDEEFIKYYLYREPINLAKNKFAYYPPLRNASKFIPELLKKKEFYENQNEAPSKHTNKTKGFRKSSAQKFLKNYISEDTPYNGVLIWHEVGVGKTCAAIGIAENFKNMIDSPDKKTIVLTPGKTLTESWYDEIFNIKKELKNSKNNYNQQCTGNNYTKLKIINYKKPEDYARIKRRRDKIISEYYSITGYRTFVNKFYKGLKKYMEQNVEQHEQQYYNKYLIKFIEDKYSNRVFMLDEIHYTRADDSSTTKAREGKKIRTCLELIVRYAKNVKLVLLSATPMYDKASEIIWLINLLRLNDKRSPLNLHQFFKNDELIPESKPKFLDNIRGYISYQRGEDPFVFPTKLYPSINNADWKNLYIPNNPECLVRSGIYSLSDLDKKKSAVIKDGGNIKYLTLYQSVMDPWQYKHYRIVKKSKSRGYDVKPRQYSNIIYPNVSEEGTLLHTPWGIDDNNYKKLFIKEGPQYRIHDALIEDNKSILNVDRIGKYSKKIQNILKIIKDTEGVIFIYSQFIHYGAQILAFCLEENGYSRFNCNSNGTILKNQDLIKNPTGPKESDKSYILLTGQTRKNILNKLKDYANSPNNKMGKKIKVIIGTSVVEQGISFYNVRQIHIMDPWYNINSLNQIIGRGVRRFSHHMLEESKRNVTIYLHASVAPPVLNIKKKTKKKPKILTDEHLYSLSLTKYAQVLDIQRLMKIGSVDCNLNKRGNIFLGLDTTHISSIDARGNDRGEIPLNDLDKSIRCDLVSCSYNCHPEIDLSDISDGLDTYGTKISDEKITIYIEEIKNIFSSIFAIHLDDLEQKLNLNISRSVGTSDAENKNLILAALTTLIKSKATIYNTIINRNGFISVKTDKKRHQTYYIFQESDNDNELIKNKYLAVNNITKDFYIDDIAVIQTETRAKNKTIDNLIDLLMLSIYNSIIQYWEDAEVMIHAQNVTKDRVFEQFQEATSLVTECNDVPFITALSEKDTKNNGTIKRVDLENILRTNGYKMNDLEFNRLFDIYKIKLNEDFVDYMEFIKNLPKKPCHINLKDAGTTIYRKKDLFTFGVSSPPDLKEIIKKRNDTLFKNTYAFNNYRTTLFREKEFEADELRGTNPNIDDYFHMTAVSKPKTSKKFSLTYPPPPEDSDATVRKSKTAKKPSTTLTIVENTPESTKYTLNRFYDGIYHKHLPNIYDIIYNQFLTYIEDKPLEMRNEDLKNIFKEIHGEPIQKYIDSFFIHKNSSKSHFDQTPYRIDFNDINNKETLKLQVIKIFFYSYFSSANLDVSISSSENLKKTHPYRKFSYFLTDKMFQIAQSYKLPSEGREPNYNPKNIVISGDDQIKYLVIPVSSTRGGAKSKRKGRIGKDGFLLYDIERIEEPPSSKFTKYKHYFNSFFPMSDNYFGFYKSKVYGFTAFNLGESSKSFYVVNSDSSIDPSYVVSYTASSNGKKISKKSLRKGAACGHGLGAKTKVHLGKLINAMIYKITGVDDKYKKYGGWTSAWKHVPPSPDLCMELKLLLRHLDSLGYIDNSAEDPAPLDASTRYFYHEHIKDKINRSWESINF